MSWGAQNRSKDAKTPSVGRAMSDKPELDRCPVQPYPAQHARDLYTVYSTTALTASKTRLPVLSAHLHPMTKHRRQKFPLPSLPLHRCCPLLHWPPTPRGNARMPPEVTPRLFPLTPSFVTMPLNETERKTSVLKYGVP